MLFLAADTLPSTVEPNLERLYELRWGFNDLGSTIYSDLQSYTIFATQFTDNRYLKDDTS